MWKEIGIVVFIIITGLNWAYYQVYSGGQITPSDASFNIFVEVLGTGLTILVLDQIWHAEERKRWKEVKHEVYELLNGELNDIFNDMALILVPPKAFEFQTHEELAQKTLSHQEDVLTRLAEGNVKEVKKRIIREKHLLEGGYGDLFQRRYETLNGIEMKYSKFLDPSILRILIKLQAQLERLSSHIRTRLKLKAQDYGKFLVPTIENGIYYTVQEIVKILLEAKKIGIYSLPNV